MRRVVIVSGPPGAGKSTLATPLAGALGLPLLSKDIIKETLADSLGSVAEDEFASSRRLGAASMELLWRLAAECPAVVLEANFRSGSEYERQRLLGLSAVPVEVYCRVPAAVAEQRFALRGASSSHHAVHVTRTLPAEAFAEFQEPFHVGPVIEVDTTSAVKIAALAEQVTSAGRW